MSFRLMSFLYQLHNYAIAYFNRTGRDMRFV